MAAIGSWWVKGFGARPREEVEEAFYANYLRGEARPLGGKLYVTSERVLFCPHLLDAALGGSRRMIARATIDRVERSSERGNDRVTIQLEGGERVRFVTDDVDGLITALAPEDHDP